MFRWRPVINDLPVTYAFHTLGRVDSRESALEKAVHDITTGLDTAISASEMSERKRSLAREAARLEFLAENQGSKTRLQKKLTSLSPDYPARDGLKETNFDMMSLAEAPYFFEIRRARNSRHAFGGDFSVYDYVAVPVSNSRDIARVLDKLEVLEGPQRDQVYVDFVTLVLADKIAGQYEDEDEIREEIAAMGEYEAEALMSDATSAYRNLGKKARRLEGEFVLEGTEMDNDFKHISKFLYLPAGIGGGVAAGVWGARQVGRLIPPAANIFGEVVEFVLEVGLFTAVYGVMAVGGGIAGFELLTKAYDRFRPSLPTDSETREIAPPTDAMG